MSRTLASTHLARTAVIAGLFLSTIADIAHAAPFEKQLQFQQPNGITIDLWGRGDEFNAVFETLDGYTVVFDPLTKSYLYASISEDGSTLIPTDMAVGNGEPQARNLAKHLRITADATKQQAAARFQQWEQGMQSRHRWNNLKARHNDLNKITASDAPLAPAPPASTTTDTKIGLCILIDFDNDPASIPQADIVDFCNADNYTGYDNNGSVKQYFLDNSNNKLNYTNIVTAYVRIPNSMHPKSSGNIMPGYTNTLNDNSAPNAHWWDGTPSGLNVRNFSTAAQTMTFDVGNPDHIVPTVTINQAAIQADPSNGTTINFTVVFSEPVADFATGDVAITGTAPGTKTAAVTGGGALYNVAVTGMTGSGTVIASLAAGMAHDAVGYANPASASTDHSVSYVLTHLQTWRQQFFSTYGTDGNASDTADPNDNGIVNLLEYALGGDPVAHSGAPGILPQAALTTNGALQISFTRYIDRNGITMTVQGSDSLTGPWMDMARSTGDTTFTALVQGATATETGTGPTRAVKVADLYPATDPAHPRRFMRLHVTNP